MDKRRKHCYGWISDDSVSDASGDKVMETIKSMVEEVAGPSKKGGTRKARIVKKAKVDAPAKKIGSSKELGKVVANEKSDSVKGKHALNPVKIEVESDEDNADGRKMKTPKQIERVEQMVAEKKVVKSSSRIGKKGRALNIGNAKAVKIKQPDVKVKTVMRNGKKVYRWYITVAKTTETNVQHFPREIIRNCLTVDQNEIEIADCDLRQLFKCTIVTGRRNGLPSPFERYMTKGWYNYVKTKGVLRGDTLVCQMDDSQPRMYVAFSTVYGRRIANQ